MKRFILSCLAAAAIFSVSAQTDRPESIYKSLLKGIEYEINAGFNIGGASPIPLPAEIRSINSFHPTLSLSLGGVVTKWFAPEEVTRKWGVAVGLRFERRGMETGATVKNYGMEIINNGDRLNGRWTGKVKTEYASQQLTIPVTAVFKINPRWKVNFGPYIAFVFDRKFSGEVSDGYLRAGDPTGTKWEFTDGKIATYNFDNEMRRFQWGLQAGASWRAFKRLTVNANLTWGLNDIFYSSFKTVTFNMYPIYLNLGFGYVF